jgi:hypothetical protein
MYTAHRKPSTVDGALADQNFLTKPTAIIVNMAKKFPEIQHHIFN